MATAWHARFRLTMTCISCTLRVMKLEEWMAANKMSDAELAGRVGRDRSVVSKLRKGQILPSIEVLGVLTRISEGQVTVADFLPPQAAE